MIANQNLPHNCNICGKQIKEGDQYMYIQRKHSHYYVHSKCFMDKRRQRKNK